MVEFTIFVCFVSVFQSYLEIAELVKKKKLPSSRISFSFRVLVILFLIFKS